MFINYLPFIQEPIIRSKLKIYVSRFSPLIPPTASTLCNKTSSIPYVSNISGSMVLEKPVHSYIGNHSTFGKPARIIK